MQIGCRYPLTQQGIAKMADWFKINGTTLSVNEGTVVTITGPKRRCDPVLCGTKTDIHTDSCPTHSRKMEILGTTVYLTESDINSKVCWPPIRRKLAVVPKYG